MSDTLTQAREAAADVTKEAKDLIELVMDFADVGCPDSAYAMVLEKLLAAEKRGMEREREAILAMLQREMDEYPGTEYRRNLRIAHTAIRDGSA